MVFRASTRAKLCLKHSGSAKRVNRLRISSSGHMEALENMSTKKWTILTWNIMDASDLAGKESSTQRPAIKVQLSR